MSKGLKIGLWVGIPIVIVIFLVVVVAFLNSGRTGSQLSSMDMFYGGDYKEAGISPPSPSEKGLRFSMTGEQNVVANLDKLVLQPINTSVQDDMVSGELPADRLIIKTGDISMVVENVRAGIKAISDYVVEKGGFVVSSNVDKTGLTLYGNITFRIPVGVFDQAGEDIKNMGEVTSESMNGQDVTEEYVDLDAQLKNYRATEQQFLEIMKKAYEIEDILAVQNQLTIVRGNIERIEGRMKYLRESASMSTLSVYLSTDPDVLPAWDEEDQWKPWGVIKEAVRSLVSFGQGLVNLLIWVVIYIPLWLIIWLVVWIVIRIVKRITHGKKNVVKTE